MSTIVVTPPAAAERVDQMKSSWSFWLSEWVWASMAPGRMMPGPQWCGFCAGGGEDEAGPELVAVMRVRRRALADMGDLAVAHGDVAALDDHGGQHDCAG